MSELRITLAKQQLETTKEQGKAAIALIEASSPAPAAAPANAAPGVRPKPQRRRLNLARTAALAEDTASAQA